VEPPSRPTPRSYLVFELLDRDLKNCLDLVKPMMMVDPRASTASAASFAMPKYVGGGLPRAVVKWYTYSMLAGIQACHEARILHRDIKPQNILLNAAGDLKIADFGLARTYAIPLRPYTHEVVTLWYRAPEILLGETTYSPAVDVWSIGCIMPEMASGRALFEGDSEIDQIHRVFRVLGHPTEEQWRGVSKMTDYRRNMPSFRPQDVSQWAGHIDETGRDLLLRMLEYDPAKRISAADALRHPYFDDIAAVEVEARAAIAAAVAVEQAEAAAANRERADARERARAGE
jgi:serine/threonine protein kinase